MVFHGSGPGRSRSKDSRLGQVGCKIIQGRPPAHLVALLQPPLVCGHATDPKARRRVDEPDVAIRRWLADEVDGVVVAAMARQAGSSQGRGLAQQISVQGRQARRPLAIAEGAGEHHGYGKHIKHTIESRQSLFKMCWYSHLSRLVSKTASPLPMHTLL